MPFLFVNIPFHTEVIPLKYFHLITAMLYLSYFYSFLENVILSHPEIRKKKNNI